MKTNNPQVVHMQWIRFVLAVALFFGFFIRFYPTLQTGFPPNDGGMFFRMIRDLAQNEYILPEFTSYNLLEIPYAYPPFGFYVARSISDGLRISELNVLRFLPPLVNSVSILVFYFLASEVLRSKTLGVLASAFYALTPGAFGWFIMGGGLTRSFGSIFLLCTIFVIHKLYRTGDKKYIGWGSVWGGLTVLSHPEAGIHAAVTCFLLWMFFGQTRQSLLYSILISFGVLVFSSPWWLAVISVQGLSPFLSAIQTGSYGSSIWVALYKLILGESVLPVLAVFRLTGLLWGLWKREYFLLVWVFLPYLVEPRSAPSVSFYPVTMLIALAFDSVFLFFADRLYKQNFNAQKLFDNRVYNISLLVLLMYLFVECNLYGFRLVGNTLKPDAVQAMKWIQGSTPADAKFISITGVLSPETDAFIEWFPALAERRNQSTIQGYEWVLGEAFYTRYTDLAELQRCKTVYCIEDWSAKTGLDYHYIVVVKTSSNELLLLSFKYVKTYTQIYDNDAVTVYQK